MFEIDQNIINGVNINLMCLNSYLNINCIELAKLAYCYMYLFIFMFNCLSSIYLLIQNLLHVVLYNIEAHTSITYYRPYI